MGSQFPNTYTNPGNPFGDPPGVCDSEFKTVTTIGPREAIYTAGSVLVSTISGAYNTVHVSWPTVAGATAYKVYFGFSLHVEHAVLQATLAADVLVYEFQYAPSVPLDLYPQIWITAVVSGSEVYVQADPASFDSSIDYLARANNPLDTQYSDLVIDNDYYRFSIAEMRRRLITQIALDGEDFITYMRRYSGDVCPRCTAPNSTVLGQDALQGGINDPTKALGADPAINDDPPYAAVTRCPVCFGTGIQGGYYAGYLLKLRYSNLPPRTLIFGKYAVDMKQNFNTWGLWEPKLHDHDIVLRVKTGERFEVTNSKRGDVRGVCMHQEAQLNILPAGDVRYLLSNTTISSAEAYSG